MIIIIIFVIGFGAVTILYKIMIHGVTHQRVYYCVYYVLHEEP